jgi:hypothetical protein
MRVRVLFLTAPGSPPCYLLQPGVRLEECGMTIPNVTTNGVKATRAGALEPKPLEPERHAHPFQIQDTHAT